MPKVHGTRKQKAKKLLETLERGPCFVEFTHRTGEIFRSGYNSWFRTWIKHQLIELVPELKHLKVKR